MTAKHKFIQRFTQRILRQHLEITEQGELKIINPSSIIKILQRKTENESDDYIDQLVNGFSRKMPINKHTIQCFICHRSTEVIAIGSRLPRKICYDNACKKEYQKIHTKKSRSKAKIKEDKKE